MRVGLLLRNYNHHIIPVHTFSPQVPENNMLCGYFPMILLSNTVIQYLMLLHLPMTLSSLPQPTSPLPMISSASAHESVATVANESTSSGRHLITRKADLSQTATRHCCAS